MDNLRKSIKLFFNGIDPDRLLNEIKSADNILRSDYVLNKNTFKNTAFSQYSFDYNTLDEINNIQRKVDEDWSYSPHRNNGVKSPFYLLSHFTNQVLIDEGKEPFVEYEHLLKWRDITFEIGEDVFSTSHLAYCDVISNRERHYLSWRPVLFSNNKRLKKILLKGVAENHSHLYASSLNFDISWVALMNKYDLNKTKLGNILQQGRLLGKTIYEFDTEKVEFSLLIKKAVAIRLILFESIEYYSKERETDLETYLKDKLGFDIDCLLENSNTIDSFKLSLQFEKIINQINFLGNTKALKVPYNCTTEFYDYAAINNMHPENLSGCYFLFGERYILYKSFKNLYQQLGTKKDVTLLEKFLHFYILIKNEFRNEMIQLNRRYGFGNFKAYQDRKYSLIGTNTIYNTFFLDITLNYNRELMNIVSHEVRIGPEGKTATLKGNLEKILKIRESPNTETDWRKYLSGTKDTLKYIKEFNNINNKQNSSKELFFVLHFFKKDENKYNKKFEFKKDIWVKQLEESRDKILRDTIKKSARSIIALRENDPVGRKVKGIDAASSEIAARPEAFAQAFRYLKNHTLKQENVYIKGISDIKPLNITFHAGEDFFDIVDGMRYIDECLSFLGMSHGDRFGHALAIGVNVRSYYTLKCNKLMMPKHIILDNIVWLLSKAKEFGLIAHLGEMAKLENIFKHLFSEIYLNSEIDPDIRNISYHDYYDAWKLRGDDPNVYFKLFSENNNLKEYFNDIISLDYWDRCRLNDCDYKLRQIRNRREVSRLYYEYHYNPSVKNIGNEIKQFEITYGYIKLVEAVQKCMMGIISEKNISIETNPSSNYLIGSISKYVEHPITKWYNLGLEYDQDKINNTPQISVSINTDDAGIFSTTLENEYALMAIAMEKEKDENGNPKYNKSMIYDWIEKVRQMGLEQSFNT